MTGRIPLWLRRPARLVVALGLAAGLLATPAGSAAAGPSEAESLRGARCGERILSIVAHQDDDLLFQSPDLSDSIRGGACMKTVFLTAGDAGLGEPRMKQREKGSQAAYAAMAGVKDVWQQRVYPFGARSTHRERPIQLVYLRMPDGGFDPAAGGPAPGFPSHGFATLEKLWQGSISQVRTVTGSMAYTKDALVAQLAVEMYLFAPTQIRIQDLRVSPMDHRDHAYAGVFAKAAESRYVLPHRLIGYQGYDVFTLPENVSGKAAALKQDIFLVYGKHDPEVCKTPEECVQQGWNIFFNRQYTYEIPGNK